MKSLLTVYRYIVGFELGFSGEGNEQWYYFLSLVINCMLTWWKKPELGILFTVVAVIHLLTVCIYGYMNLDVSSIYFSYGYFISHIILIAICLKADTKWTILTSAITMLSYLFAPDATGNNIVMRPSFKGNKVYFENENYMAILLFHTILFATFAVIALSLPIALWIRLAIIVICMILHPIVDLLEGECILISDVTLYAFETVIDSISDRKEK